MEILKQYKETIYKIEYDVVELEVGKYNPSDLKKLSEQYKYFLFRKIYNDKITKKFKEIFFKDGKIHNEYGYAIRKNLLSRFYLNGKEYFEEEEFINEVRNIRLNEIFQD